MQKYETNSTLAGLELAGVLTSTSREELKSALATKRPMILFGGAGDGTRYLFDALVNEYLAAAPGDFVSVLQRREVASYAGTQPDPVRTTQPVACVGLYAEADNACALLDAWKAGVGGFAVVHASEPDQAVVRFASLALQSRDMQRQVDEGFNLDGYVRGLLGYAVKVGRDGVVMTSLTSVG